jgi:hypothetical protein
MKLICLVLLVAFATAELGNTLQDVDVVDVDEIEDPKESLDKIEEGDSLQSITEPEALKDNDVDAVVDPRESLDKIEEGNSSIDDDRVEVPESDNDVNDDSNVDLSDMDRYGCSDRGWFCGYWVYRGCCTNRWRGWMSRNCRKSCGFCSTKTKVNCQLSSWGRWSSCSKTCGSGVSARTRRIVKHARNGGRRCYGSSRATKYCCIRRTCPPRKVNCQWSSWSRWSSCSKTCGSGVNTRTRRIVKYARNGGSRCYGSSRATKYCCIRRTCPAKQQRYHVRYAYNGGCATYRQNYPRSLGGIVRTGSYSRCLALCKRNSNCGWFEYCFGSNCKGNCLLNPKSLPVCKGNHYPTVKCYKLTRY